MALALIPKAFKMISEYLLRVEIRQLSTEMPNLKIKVPSSFSHNFYYFSQTVYKWPWQRFLGLSNWFLKMSRNFILVNLMLGWLISTFGYLQVSLIVSFICLKFTSLPIWNGVNKKTYHITTLNMVFRVIDYKWPTHTNCKPWYRVTNTIMLTQWFFCHSLILFWGIIDLQCCNCCHLPSDFHPNFNHQWQHFITSCWQDNVGFWPMDELIHHPWQYV